MENRLDGLIKDSVREEDRAKEVETDGLAHRAAYWTVVEYANHLGIGQEETDDPLTMLGLPLTCDNPLPLTEEEREQLVHCLPRSIILDTRSPSNNLLPERKFAGKGTWL